MIQDNECCTYDDNNNMHMMYYIHDILRKLLYFYTTGLYFSLRISLKTMSIK